jgi:TctA family transporter
MSDILDDINLPPKKFNPKKLYYPVYGVSVLFLIAYLFKYMHLPFANLLLCIVFGFQFTYALFLAIYYKYAGIYNVIFSITFTVFLYIRFIYHMVHNYITAFYICLAACIAAYLILHIFFKPAD